MNYRTQVKGDENFHSMHVNISPLSFVFHNLNMYIPTIRSSSPFLKNAYIGNADTLYLVAVLWKESKTVLSQ